MKHVLLVAYDLNPNLGSESGVADQILNMVSERHRITVITLKKHQKDIESCQYRHTEFIFIPVPGILPDLLLNLKLYNLHYILFMRKVYQKLNRMNTSGFDLIHCLTPAGLHSYNMLFQYRRPMLIGPLGGGLKMPPGFSRLFRNNRVKTFLRNSYYRLLPNIPAWKRYYRSADLIIAGTPHVKDYLPRNCRCKTRLIFDGMITPEDYPLASGSKSTDIRICYVGRMEPHKGCELLFDVFSKLKAPNLELHFAGSGPLLSRLKKKAARKNLTTQVTFHGKISKERVKELLAGSDIFCLPTLREPGGVAILEAMAAGLPVITTDYGGPAFSVTKETGIKITPIDYEQYCGELSNAISRLISDKKLRQKMGRNGRLRVSREFSFKSLHRRINQVYEEVLNKGQAQESCPQSLEPRYK